MEASFFASMAALAFELALFFATVLYAAVHWLRGKGGSTRALWWPVALTALAGGVATLLSIHYVANDAQRSAWLGFVACAVGLPVILAIVVALLRRDAD